MSLLVGKDVFLTPVKIIGLIKMTQLEFWAMYYLKKKKMTSTKWAWNLIGQFLLIKSREYTLYYRLWALSRPESCLNKMT